jgi:hypothetical protein
VARGFVRGFGDILAIFSEHDIISKAKEKTECWISPLKVH